MLHPANTQGDKNKIDQLRKEKEERELQELTLKPKTLAEQNKKLAAEAPGPKEDRNMTLYKSSKIHMKKEKTTEEIEFEKSQKELTFKPKINKRKEAKPRARNEERTMEILEQRFAKMIKHKEEQEFKSSGIKETSVKYFGGKDSA